MRSRNCSLVSAIGALVLALAMVPSGLAQCGLNKNYVKPSAWHPQLGSAHFMHAALFDDDRRLKLDPMLKAAGVRARGTRVRAGPTAGR